MRDSGVEQNNNSAGTLFSSVLYLFLFKNLLHPPRNKWTHIFFLKTWLHQCSHPEDALHYTKHLFVKGGNTLRCRTMNKTNFVLGYSL